MNRCGVRVLAAWVLLLAVGVGYLWRYGHLQTDVSGLLPAGASPAERLLLDQLRSGSTMRLMLLAVEGATSAELAGASHYLAEWMRASGEFDFVANGETVADASANEVLLEHRYLLSSTSGVKLTTPEALREALSQRLAEMASPLGILSKRLLHRDPTGAYMDLIKSWQPTAIPEKHAGVWMTTDGTRALLLAQTKEPGYAFAPQQALQQRLLSHFRAFTQAGTHSTMQLLTTGPAVFTVRIQEHIERDAWRLSIFATITVTLFLLLTYRSLLILGLSLLPLISAIVGGAVAVNLLFGSIHGITLAFGITLLGVVDDYPIHLFCHATRSKSPQRVLREIWPPMRLSILTTALGFGAMVFADFPGLTHLGVFAVSGLLSAAVVTRWVIPDLIPEQFAAPATHARLLRWAHSLSRMRVAIPLVVILALLTIWQSPEPLWEEDVDRLTPVPTHLKALDRELRHALGAPDVRYIVAASADSVQQALESSEDIGKLLDSCIAEGHLGGYDAPHHYLPSERTQRHRQEQLPDRKQLQQTLHAAMQGLAFKPGIFANFLDDVVRQKQLVPLSLENFRGTMPGGKMDAMLQDRNGQWTIVLPLHDVRNVEALSLHFSRSAGSEATFLDLKAESGRMVEGFRDGAIRLLAWGALAILLVLSISERDLRSAIGIMLPMLCALICVIAVFQFLHERLSLFHIASLLLVIGLGLDYAVFFNHRHIDRSDLQRTMTGVLICSTTTVIVFGMLGCSEVPVLHAIGTTAAMGSLFSLIFAIMLAPRGQMRS